MVAVLIRMKLAVMRNGMSGEALARLGLDVVFGLAAVALTFMATLAGGGSPVLLALAFGVWTIGWALGPIMYTGEDKTLLPENFRSLPVSPERLATGLLAAALVGVPAAISLLAYLPLFVYALKLGVLPALLAVPAIVLQLLFSISLSRVLTSAMRKLTRSQFSSALSSMVTGGIMAFFISGWFLLGVDRDMTALLTDSRFADVLFILPSGWAVGAVAAAGSGQWIHAVAYVAGLALAIALLRTVWASLLERRLTTKPEQGRTVRRVASRYGRWANRTGAVARKELASWRRDYTRSGFVYFAFFYSVILCLYPLAVGDTSWLPWAGALFAVTAVGSTANMYGSDGSALWMTLVTPNTERSDVRGRQLAWMLIVGPAALIVTVAAIAISGNYWALPMALTLVIAALGAGGGLVVLNSAYRLEPMTDAHKRGDDLFDHPIGWWQFMSLIIATIALIAPAAGLAALGMRLEELWLQWAGVPAALISGGFCYWGFGRLAARYVEKSGPELLQLMLRGHKPKQPSRPTKSNAEAVMALMPLSHKAIFYGCMFVAPVALFPQGLVPLVFKLAGGTVKSWFLALHVSEAWQWPVIAFMILAGLAAFGCGAMLYQMQLKKMPQQTNQTV